MPNNINTNRFEPANTTNTTNQNTTGTNTTKQNTTRTNSTNQNTETTGNNIRNTRNTLNTTTRSTNIRLAENPQAQQQSAEATNEPITITTSLETKITYYVWIKDINGNTSYQTLKIDKAQI